jgi:putative transposase
MLYPNAQCFYVTIKDHCSLAMKKTKFTEAQIAFALKQANTGTRVDEVCRKMGISEATFYNGKKKYGGLGVSELKRMRQLEEENHRLKQIVADLTLDKQMLKDVLKKFPKAAPAKGLCRAAHRPLLHFCSKGLQGGMNAPLRMVLQGPQKTRWPLKVENPLTPYC